MAKLVEATEYKTIRIKVTGKRLPQFLGKDEKGENTPNENVSIVMAKDATTGNPLKKGCSISWDRAKAFNLTKIAINPNEHDNSNGDIVVDMSGESDKLILDATVLDIPKNGAYRDKKTGELVPYRVDDTFQIVMIEEVKPDKMDMAISMFERRGQKYDDTNPDHFDRVIRIMATL